jgi:hypothetical protein
MTWSVTSPHRRDVRDDEQVKLTLDLHDMYNCGSDIDRALQSIDVCWARGNSLAMTVETALQALTIACRY